MRLKSLFEGIFEKYGRDFSDVGDEIDLKTGEIVVNKGHILGMQDEGDIGKGTEQLVQDRDTSFAQSRDSSLGSATGGKVDPLQDVGKGRYVEATTGKAVLHSLMAREAENDFGVDGPSDADDDRSSVDSLLGDAVTVADNNSQALQDQSTGILKSPFPRYPEGTSTKDSDPKGQAVDPLWQVPDIDVKFSTPTTNKKPLQPDLDIPQARSASPPTAGSIWAPPSSGRRRNTDVQKKRKSPKRKSPGVRSKRKRKLPVVRDWSFAQLRDDSDSDDPLQEDFPSPASRSASSFCSPRPMSVTPTPTKGKADRMHSLEGRKQKTDVDGLDGVRQSGRQSSPGAQDTPESKESSSSVQDSASIVEMGKSHQNGIDADANAISLLTPDEVRLVVQIRKVQKSSWQDVIDCLPGRKLANLYNWDRLLWVRLRSHRHFADQVWSTKELDKLERFKDQSGLSWKDIQAELPSRSQEEIEYQLLRRWAGNNEIWGTELRKSSQHPDDPRPGSEDGGLVSQTNFSTPQRPNDDTAKFKQPEDLLAEDSDDLRTKSGISSIQIEGKPGGSTAGSRRKSPAKGSVSPLAKYSAKRL
ncbi:Myb-like DNA-binding domain protein [Rasamsonia emersonii CBS 393.64]|uniref:Myb-like DNA-binding domain protein n=1 Tax=Rasamsonia emersonii (strain ATCC 16479 / CBS 393.64 / IMI 116815) TaxID=1408163 RepID=A0A0F4YZQ8_RASE3|nr:Myb-like DNA-binding domain protein [Rasamsonia emersonii CBS 393.64]KKA23757.1 Myb-like DNA-binding domain protein [Rasamsonia emersonii CBS 393.64]